jgi:hypothetical protein
MSVPIEGQHVDIEDMEGRTVARTFRCQTNVAIGFTDGTFVAFRIELGYESGDERLVVDQSAPSDYALRKLGLITDDEFHRRRDERSRLELERRERMDRETYERLKKRFGEVKP